MEINHKCCDTVAVGIYKLDNGEVMEWEFGSVNGEPVSRRRTEDVFEDFQRALTEHETYQMNEDGTVDFTNHTHPDITEIKGQYTIENFEVRCFTCWGRIGL